MRHLHERQRRLVVGFAGTARRPCDPELHAERVAKRIGTPITACRVTADLLSGSANVAWSTTGTPANNASIDTSGPDS